MNLLKSLTIEKIYLFYVILFAAQATLFTSDMDFRSNPIGVGLLILLCIRLLIKHKITLHNKNLLIIYLILLLWATFHYLIDKEFKLLPYLILFINVTIGYSLINIFGTKIYELTTKYITYLTGISIFVWAIMLITGTRFFESISFMKPASSTSIASLLIFNIPNTDIYEGQGIGTLMRNCGFAWEPGLFASFTCIAIYFNLIITKQIKKNWGFYILTIGLISTFSTTGYCAFILILINYFILQNRKKSHKYLFLILTIPLLSYVMGLSFMADKIEKEDDNFMYNNNQLIRMAESEGNLITVRRGEGIFLDYLNFQEKPILGYGTGNNSYVSQHISPYIISSNGITSTFAQFGLILALLINITFILNSKYLDKLYGQKYCIFYILFMTLSISYSFTTLALIIALCGGYLWINQPKNIHK